MAGREAVRARQREAAVVPVERATPERRSAAPAPTGLAQLQRQVGNRAVLALLGAQARLSVGSVDDPLELEADRTAGAVVAALRSTGVSTGVAPAAGRIVEEDDDAPGMARTLRRAPARAPIGADGGELDTDLEQRLSSARSGGSPLSEGVRRSMEGAFGADFSGVRVHQGSGSASLNQDLGATAFTVGRDIFFRGPAPDASSAEGQHLLAHELAHTVQQGAARLRPLEE